MSDGRVLLVESDRDRRERWRELLEFADYEPVMLASAAGLARADGAEGDCLAALVGVDVMPLDQAVDCLRARDRLLPIVTYGLQPGQPAPAGDGFCANLALPVKYPELIGALKSARQWRMTRQAGGRSFPVGRSAAAAGLEQLMRQVARFDSTVLVQGESGTGKELVARRIHALSHRANGPFVPVNCGAIPRDLLESELFGHEKGAFTGAISQRIGRFELAAGGTLFLDEIGDMSIDMQVKLLRVLQERIFERIGSHRQRSVDLRIIAATHRDLPAMVGRGEFREDLFFRLNVFPIEVPPLRNRAADVPDLVADLIRQGVREGLGDVCFTDDSMELLAAHAWPGNVRELRNLLERLSILHADTTIDRGLLASYLQPRPGAAVPQRGPAGLPAAGIDLREHLADIERGLIADALDRAGGTVAKAARLLRLQRTTLVEKLRRYELTAT
jgi:sigma-54 specific flagellar transcriptional regulator A